MPSSWAWARLLRRARDGRGRDLQRGALACLNHGSETYQLFLMAWRIDEQVVRGEIDNRTRGKVTGRIWIVNREQPVVLELEGNPWRDLAGHVLRFVNPTPVPGLGEDLMTEQRGVVGDITASRKVKVPEVSMEELMECYSKKQPFPWHWGNSLYLEWFSERNGRVVIESSAFTLELEGEAAWTMSEEDEVAQRKANGEAMTGFMDRMLMVVNDAEDDEPHSTAEAAADAEAARMDQLLDRVQARIEREGGGDFDFDVIYQEERERLRRERGEIEPPPPTPEQLAERQAWIDEMNSICEEAVKDAEAEAWKDEEDERHPLVERCLEFSSRLHDEICEWLPEDAPREHPLAEIAEGVQFAAVKLGGALHDEEWPPAALFAGNVLVRLKKARDYLRDSLAAMDSADQEGLAEAPWRAVVRSEVAAILVEVEALIADARQVLADEDLEA